MTLHTGSSSMTNSTDPALSLYHLLDPEVLANPYPLYHRLRSEDPVHWDHFLHTWVATRYMDVVAVFQRFSANRTPTPEQFTAMGMSSLTPLAQVMVQPDVVSGPTSSWADTRPRIESIHLTAGGSPALTYPAHYQ